MHSISQSRHSFAGFLKDIIAVFSKFPSSARLINVLGPWAIIVGKQVIHKNSRLMLILPIQLGGKRRYKRQPCRYRSDEQQQKGELRGVQKWY
jgi:hypothetical protein